MNWTLNTVLRNTICKDFKYQLEMHQRPSGYLSSHLSFLTVRVVLMSRSKLHRRAWSKKRSADCSQWKLANCGAASISNQHLAQLCQVEGQLFMWNIWFLTSYVHNTNNVYCGGLKPLPLFAPFNGQVSRRWLYTTHSWYINFSWKKWWHYYFCQKCVLSHQI